MSRKWTVPQTPTTRRKNVSGRFVLPESLKLRQPRAPVPKIPPTPEELRPQRLEEMLQWVQAWLVERFYDYQYASNVLDKARNLLARSQNLPAQRVPEPPMSAQQLLNYTRPPELDAAKSQTIFRREETWALWLARWLTAWAPQNKKLCNDVLNQARDHL